MKITNKFGMPTFLYRTVAGCMTRAHAPGENRYASITDLIQPGWKGYLYHTYDQQLETDVMYGLDAMIGTATHAMCHEHNEDCSETISEGRLAIEIDGKKITGGFDNYMKDPETGKYTLFEVKTCKTWAVVYDDQFQSYVEQVQMYGYMLRTHNFPVESIKITCIFKDWSATKAKAGGKYPSLGTLTYDIEPWSDAQCEDFLESKVLRLEAIKTNIAQLQLSGHSQAVAEEMTSKFFGCTERERWQKPTTYAVMKEGNKRAKKLFYTEDDEKMAEMLALPGHSLQVRPGERTRCQERYCSALNICAVYKEYIASGAQPASEEDESEVAA